MLKQADSTADHQKNYKWDIVWRNVIIMMLFHAAAFYGFYLHWTSALLWTSIFAKVYGLTSLLASTTGPHRLWSHKSFKANNFVQIALMLTCSMIYQNSIYTWVKDHRLHHQQAETDADPHNAKRGFFFSHIGWIMVRRHKDVIKKGKQMDFSDLEANPIIMFQYRYYYPIMFLLTFIIPISIPCYFWNESFKVSFFTVGFYRVVINLHAIWSLNSFAHKYGNKPFDKAISSTESPLMLYVGLGDGFHNYHHTFPWDYKAAEFGNDSRNVTTMLIDALAYFGMVTDRKEATKEIIESRVDRTGDGSYGEKSFVVSYFGSKFNEKFISEVKNLVLIGLYLYVL